MFNCETTIATFSLVYVLFFCECFFSSFYSKQIPVSVDIVRPRYLAQLYFILYYNYFAYILLFGAIE